MKPYLARLSLIFALAALGCTKATPQFETLDSTDIPQPLFSGATEILYQTSDAARTFAVSGECDRKIRDLRASVVGLDGAASEADRLSVSGVTLGCDRDGKFAFTLKSLSDLGITPSEGQIVEVELRGETKLGLSRASHIRIRYSTKLNSTRVTRVTAGSTVEAHGGNFRAAIRVGAPITDAALKSGGMFKARIGVTSD